MNSLKYKLVITVITILKFLVTKFTISNLLSAKQLTNVYELKSIWKLWISELIIAVTKLIIAIKFH